jgi:hypothetical protein
MKNYELRLKNCESKSETERRSQPNEVEEIERIEIGKSKKLADWLIEN